MALTGNKIVRVFRYNVMTLNDPSPEKTVDQVRMFYATMYPELLNSEIEGPVTKGGTSTYTFVRAVGSKGIGLLRALRNVVEEKHGVDRVTPLSNASLNQIQESQKCSTIVQSIVNNRQKSTPLLAPQSAYSRFG